MARRDGGRRSGLTAHVTDVVALAARRRPDAVLGHVPALDHEPRRQEAIVRCEVQVSLSAVEHQAVVHLVVVAAFNRASSPALLPVVVMDHSVAEMFAVVRDLARNHDFVVGQLAN